MDEYIERDAVHDLVRSLTKYAWTSPNNTGHRVTVDADDVNFGVDKIPAADVAPVKHGRWEKQSGLYSCSECGMTCPYDVQADVIEYWACNYCPNCGAKMNGGGEDG